MAAIIAMTINVMDQLSIIDVCCLIGFAARGLSGWVYKVEMDDYRGNAAKRQEELADHASILSPIVQHVLLDSVNALVLTIEENACELLCSIRVFARSGLQVLAAFESSLPSRHDTVCRTMDTAHPGLFAIFSG